MTGTLDLSGTWRLFWSDGQRSLLEHAARHEVDENRAVDAAVPGEVHLDLWRAGLISDPYGGTNVLAARWVEEYQWTYRRTFDLDEVPPGRAWLVFDGLDLNATILLNGPEVGRHHNFFYPCRLDVTGKLRAGTNTLIVHLDSGLWGASDKPARGWEHWPDQILNKRHWMRKPQCQFGWDWAQRLINVGIYKPVRLEWTDEPVRAGQLVPLAELSEDLLHGAVRVRWFLEGLTDQTPDAEVTIELPEAGTRTASPIQVRPGENACEATVQLENPKLWWPVGHGEQARYEVRVTLRVAGRVLAERSARVGFRHVRFDQSPNPAGGRYFTIEINGRKVFARGANFVPADMIFARIDRARYVSLIALALEQNLNFLRVWGGGLYESDDFYDLCDEHGILVWQEFIFACSRYPTSDETFFSDVLKEAAYNVRRLASHPSLIAWCGNNEIEWGDWDWDYGHRGVILPDHGFFHITLPRLLAAEDPTRYYQPSSPFSPDGMHPNHDHAGDQHPWSVGFFNYDIRDYRKMTCRFPSEGGVLGPPSLPTVLACLPEGQRRVHSFAWQVHDNSVTTWTQPHAPDEFVRRWSGHDPATISVEEFTFHAGLLQGEGLREYCENFRRRLFDSSGAVFWMLNDCWPTTRSWATIDYFLRRTPAFWAVKRAMAPLHVVLAVDESDVVVFGINDTPHAVTGELSFGVMPLDHAAEAVEQRRVTLHGGASSRLASFPLTRWKRPNEACAFATLGRAGELVARNRLFLPMFSELRWPTPEIGVHVYDGRAEFRCSSFAWGVCLDLTGEKALDDNFFDIYPGIPHVIPWDAAAAEPEVRFIGNAGMSDFSPSSNQSLSPCQNVTLRDGSSGP